MYGFLVLLPLTIISVLIGTFILLSPQLADYVAFISEVNTPEGKTVWQHFLNNKPYWTRIASHLVAYAIVCFALTTTVRTVSNPLPADRPAVLRFFQMALEAIFVAVPTLVLLWISGRAWWMDTGNPVLALTVGVLCIGLIASVLITARRYQLELYGSSLHPLSVKTPDLLAFSSLLVVAGIVAAFALAPRNSAHIIGMFPVLMLATAVAFLGVAAVFSRRASTVAVVSSLITGVLCLHVANRAIFPDREFRYTVASSQGAAAAKAGSAEVAAIKAQRRLPDLTTGLRAWLEHRRPAIEAYHKQGRAYPIFFVSAQGGGMYAAYHPALSLARLADSCPEFAHHVFGITSVSGGSLGAAVYAEAIRTLRQEGPHDPSAARVGCSDVGAPTMVNTPIEGYVRRFFETDFLSPVIASAFIFDIPSLIIPQLRFGQDRASALETGFETSWERLGISRPGDGLAANFYERWDPTGLSPALFMATTGVNFGIPILISQIDYSRIQAMSLTAKGATKERAAIPQGEVSELIKSVRERFAQTEEALQVGIGNVLDFRPDLQMATSTAAVLSARFPFVTPPGLIHENSAIPKGHGLFRNIKTLELTDGGFYDNSGGYVTRDIIAAMQHLLDADPSFDAFKNSVTIHWIRFTDTPTRRLVTASEGGHHEFVTPIVAYDAVRQSRGVLAQSVPPKTGVSYIYLLDDWYQGTLNWLLSNKTKIAIDKRSSWLAGYENTECCLVTDQAEVTRKIPLLPEQKPELEKAGYKLKPLVPNADQFNRIRRFVDKGVPLRPDQRLTPEAAQGSPAPAPDSPPAK